MQRSVGKSTAKRPEVTECDLRRHAAKAKLLGLQFALQFAYFASESLQIRFR